MQTADIQYTEGAAARVSFGPLAAKPSRELFLRNVDAILTPGQHAGVPADALEKVRELVVAKQTGEEWDWRSLLARYGTEVIEIANPRNARAARVACLLELMKGSIQADRQAFQSEVAGVRHELAEVETLRHEQAQRLSRTIEALEKNRSLFHVLESFKAGPEEAGEWLAGDYKSINLLPGSLKEKIQSAVLEYVEKGRAGHAPEQKESFFAALLRSFKREDPHAELQASVGMIVAGEGAELEQEALALAEVRQEAERALAQAAAKEAALLQALEKQARPAPILVQGALTQYAARRIAEIAADGTEPQKLSAAGKLAPQLLGEVDAFSKSLLTLYELFLLIRGGSSDQNIKEQFMKQAEDLGKNRELLARLQRQLEQARRDERAGDAAAIANALSKGQRAAEGISEIAERLALAQPDLDESIAGYARQVHKEALLKTALCDSEEINAAELFLNKLSASWLGTQLTAEPFAGWADAIGAARQAVDKLLSDAAYSLMESWINESSHLSIYSNAQEGAAFLERGNACVVFELTQQFKGMASGSQSGRSIPPENRVPKSLLPEEFGGEAHYNPKDFCLWLPLGTTETGGLPEMLKRFNKRASILWEKPERQRAALILVGLRAELKIPGSAEAKKSFKCA